MSKTMAGFFRPLSRGKMQEGGENEHLNLSAAFLLVLVAVVSIAAVSSMGESDASSDFQINVSNTLSGNYAAVEVSLENNPGIWSIEMTLNYPSEAMSLNQNSIVSGSILEMTAGADNNGTYGIYGEASGFEDVSKNGVLLALGFDIKTDMESNQIALLLSDIIVFNVSGDEIGCNVKSSAIASGGGILGDVDGNSKINGLDSLALKKYLAKWDIPIVMQNADADRNGKINGLDSLMIKKHLAKIDVGLGKRIFAGDVVASVVYGDSTQTINGITSEKNLIVPLYGTVKASDMPASKELAITITDVPPVITYTVKFDANGGSPVSYAQTVISGENAADPGSPSREGYTFKGWYTEPYGGDKFDFSTTSIDSDTILYAHWKLNKYDVTVKFTCNEQEIVPSITTSQYYGSKYTYNYMDYPGDQSQGVPAAPEAFKGYVLISDEEYTITVQVKPYGSKIVNIIEFKFDHAKQHVMLWLQGDSGYNLSFDVNYGDCFNQVIAAYGDNIGKKIGIAFEEYGTYSYAPSTVTHNGSTLTLNVIDAANTEIIYGPITENVILYYNYDSGYANRHTVSFVAYPEKYGSVNRASITVEHGTELTIDGNAISIGKYGTITATPTVSTLGDYAYGFVGWVNVPETVTKNLVIYAYFDRAPLKYAVNVIFTCEGQEIVPGISFARDYGSAFTYNYMDYPGYPSKGVPAAPEAFEGYVLISAEEYTITVQANPTGSKIVNTIEFKFDHIKQHVLLWLQGDPGYNLSFDVNYGDDFNQVIQAYGDNVGKKMGFAFEEYGKYSYAPVTTTFSGSTLTLNVIDLANTEVIFGPITSDIILYYNYR
ncbi:MAG: InlB B-repeat-containing protein [Candidatus Methanomethylophilaceae archaeon]|nr:InlB B-repeat-containing protein [Candidatus Methanomethylophilaceae archaeon]